MSPFTKNSEMTSLILDSLPMGVLFCDMDYIIRFREQGLCRPAGPAARRIAGMRHH